MQAQKSVWCGGVRAGHSVPVPAMPRPPNAAQPHTVGSLPPTTCSVGAMPTAQAGHSKPPTQDTPGCSTWAGMSSSSVEMPAKEARKPSLRPTSTNTMASSMGEHT